MLTAFFGGTFDPPHLGHLRIAQAAADHLHLDRVLLTPAALQPLKRQGAPPAGYSDRLEMLRLLLSEASDRRLAVSDLDAPRADGRPNYTYDTLLRLRAELAPEDRLLVLLGADAFLSVRHWHRACELLLLADWIIAARPGFSLHTEEALPRGIIEALPRGIVAGARLHQASGCWEQQLTAEDGRSTRLYLLSDLREDVSATQIRDALAASAPGDQEPVLAPSVLDYIRRHGLYQSRAGLEGIA